jgi:hydrogenase/urease accessory protein HupE
VVAVIGGALVLGASVAPARAHDPGLSAMTLERHHGRVSAHLVVARREIEPLAAMDTDGNGAVSPNELAVARPRLHALGIAAVVVESDGGARHSDSVAIELDESDALHVRLTFPVPQGGAGLVSVPLIHRLALGHRQYVRVRDTAGTLLAEHVLHADSPSFTVSAGAAPRTGDARGFFLLGVEHIATGYDHLLFLLALLIAGPGLRVAAAIITSFTVAHSVTLGLATLDLVRLAPAVVEPLIAASVLFVGIENLRARPLAPRWMTTFGFGLVHGLGFATALRDLGIGASAAEAIVPLLGFNLGVETGQLAVAALVLPLIWRVQRRHVLFVRVATTSSVVVAIAGAGWLIQRTLLA